MSIPFTQYLRPNGRRRPMTIDRPQPIEDLASAVDIAGGKFTCEELSTGEVSVACEYGDQDIACEVCPNGPEVEAAVDRMIKTAYKRITGRPLPRDPSEAPRA
jgi:hypothetical protein